LPFGRSRDAACPVCLDLDYNLFQDTVGSDNLEVPSYWGESRHCIAQPKDIHGSAKVGCRICAILRQGIISYWGEDVFANKGCKEEENGGIEGEHEIEKFKNTRAQTWDESPTVIFLELKPGKPLSLFLTRHISYMLHLFHNRIEFHTIASKFLVFVEYLR
jgi:hypothetical protein